jgi:hypothetical protein
MMSRLFSDFPVLISVSVSGSLSPFYLKTVCELERMGWTLYVEIDFFLSHLQIKSGCLLDCTAGLDGS